MPRVLRKSAPTSERGQGLFVNAMARGIAVLESFSGSGWNALGIREIAKRAHLNVPAAQRAVHTLTRLGYLEKDEETARYRLTPRVMDLAYIFLRSSPLYHAAFPILRNVNERVDETLTISVLDGTAAVVLLRMPSRRGMDASLVLGQRTPAFCSAAGRILLSYCDSSVRRKALAKLEQLTPKTVIDVAEVDRRIQRARAEGLAVVEEEARPTEISLAAVIVDGKRRAIAAVSVSLSTIEWSGAKARAKFGPILLQTADAISAAIAGWAPS